MTATRDNPVISVVHKAIAQFTGAQQQGALPIHRPLGPEAFNLYRMPATNERYDG